MGTMQNRIILFINISIVWRKVIVRAFFMLFFMQAIAQAAIVVSFADNSHKTFRTKKINGRQYLTLKQASEIVFHDINSNMSIGDTQNNSAYLIAFDACFFVECFKEGYISVIQMLMPALSRNGMLYVPSNEFISAIISNEIIPATYSKRKLVFQQYSMTQRETYDFETYANPFDLLNVRIPLICAYITVFLFGVLGK